MGALALAALTGVALGDQIVQEGSLSGGKGKQTHEIVVDQFDTLGGTRQLNFVQLDFLTSVIGGGQGDGSGVAVHCYARLAADYFLGETPLAQTEAVIDFVFPNTTPNSFTVFDTDTAQVIFDEAPDMAPWIGTGQITMTAQTEFTVWEDPPGIVNFSAGGGANWTVTYDFTMLPPCPDLDGDDNVGTADLLDLLAAWGTDPGGPPDFDGDGNVGTSDLLYLLSNWGPCP
jgi:hypothetical protein